MNQFPFPKLLAFLDEEKDQVEFMKIAAECGLGASDLELGKLLLALQIYKVMYAKIPREIKTVHRDALEEIQALHDETKTLVERVEIGSVQVAGWAAQIHASINCTSPEAVAQALQKRLQIETLTALSGSVRELVAAGNRLDAATAKLNAASAYAEASIGGWQTINLRRIWFRALFLCTLVMIALWLGGWFLSFNHVLTSLYLQYAHPKYNY